MLHPLSDQAHTFLATYFLVGIGLTGVTFFSGWFKKSYDGPLRQAWDVVTRLKTDKQALETRVQHLRQEYQYQAKQIEQYKAQTTAYEAQIKTLEVSYRTLETRYHNLDSEFQHLQAQAEASQTQCQNLEYELRDLRAKLENADYENEQLRQASHARDAELVTQAEAHTQLQESYRLLEAEQTALNNQWQTTKAEYETLLGHYQALHSDLTELQQQQETTRVELTDLEGRVAGIVSENRQLQDDHLWLEARLQKLRFWEWLMGGCNNYVPYSKSLLTFYVGMPLQAWWQNRSNPASSQT